MNDKIECHECGAKETHIKIRTFCGRCESHLEHYRKTRDKARDRQMALAEEVDQLRKALQGLFAAMDLCLGRSWRAETLGQGEQGDAVNRAWDECVRALVVDPATLEGR